MAFNEQKALDFLNSQKQAPTSEQEAEANMVDFLEKPPAPKPEPEKVQGEAWYKPATDMATGFNNQLLDLLGMPADLFDWAAEKLGSDQRVSPYYGSSALREYGKSLGMGTDTPGQEPDTGSYKAGEYLALGLEFLAPMLSWSKAAKVGMGTVPKEAIAGTGTGRGTAALVGEQITKPFISSPKSAYAAEIASGIGAGYGAHYGGQEFGPTGEMIGATLGGVAPVLPIYNAKRFTNYVLESYLPYTPTGGKQRAAGIIKQLSESPQVRENVEKNLDNLIPKVRLSSGKLTDDPHLMALEKVIVDSDPALARELRIQDAVNNHIARYELQSMGGDEVVEQAQKVLTSRFARLASRVNARVDIALNKVKDRVATMTPAQKRASANILARREIDSALKDARKAEEGLWNSVDKNVKAMTEQTRATFENHLKDRYKASDPAEIPAFLYRALGRLDKNGRMVGGTYSSTESVGEMQTLRSRVLKEVRKEKAKEVPDWNKVRIMEDIEESLLDDLSKSPASRELEEALSFSRELNKKFKGDIMSTILGSSRTGGSLAPNLTLEGIGAGPKGAEQIRKIITASPATKANIEDVLKMDLAGNSKVIQDGRIDIKKAKQYMQHNEQILDMFPNLKQNLDEAIGLEEKARWFEASAIERMRKAKGSVAYKIATGRPGTVLTTILKAKNPDVEMTRIFRLMNDQGKQGIKNDIIDTLISKSKTNQIGPDDIHLLEGNKMLGFWTENKKVLKKAFSEEEVGRIERVINTLRLVGGTTDLPVHAASEALKPKRTVLAYVVEVAAARVGAFFGAGTSGASLKTASQGANTARRVMGNLDIGTARSILKDAISDEKLFKELLELVPATEKEATKFKYLNSWMVAHSIENLESVQATEE